MGIGATTGYDFTATALEESEVVVLPFALMQNMARENQSMQRLDGRRGAPRQLSRQLLSALRSARLVALRFRYSARAGC